MSLMLRAAVRSIRWEGWRGMNRNADPAESPLVQRPTIPPTSFRLVLESVLWAS